MTFDQLMTLGAENGMFADIDGEPHLHPGMFVMMAGWKAYGGSDVARERGAESLRELLSLARSKGFTRADILETRLSSRDFSDRTAALAKEAMTGINVVEMVETLRKAGFYF